MKKGWEEKRLGEIIKLQYGKALDKSQRKPNGKFPVYGANGSIDRTDKSYHGEPSIIVGRKGSAGEINLTEEKFWPLDVTYFVTFDKSQHDLRFLYFLLTTCELKELAKGVKPGINRDDVYSQLVRVPPLPEQKRIVRILDEAFAAIATAKANTEKNLQNARAIFESHLNDVFTKRGDGWVETRLGAACSFLNRGVSPKYLENGGICVLNQKCIRDHRVSIEPARRHDSNEKVVSKERFVQKGDVLVNSTGTGTLGRVAQIRSKPDEPTTVDSHVTIVRPATGHFFLDFFGYLMIKIEDEIKLAGEGCGGQTELARSTLAEKFNVRYPTAINEQRRIAQLLDRLQENTQSLTFTYERKLAALEELKKSFLHQAFNGEL